MTSSASRWKRQQLRDGCERKLRDSLVSRGEGCVCVCVCVCVCRAASQSAGCHMGKINKTFLPQSASSEEKLLCRVTCLLVLTFPVPEVLCICCCIYSFWDTVESPVSWRGGYSFARSISVSYMVGNLTAPVFRDPRLTVPRITSR